MFHLKSEEFFAILGCFFGEYSNMAANEGFLTHFVGKWGLDTGADQEQIWRRGSW